MKMQFNLKTRIAGSVALVAIIFTTASVMATTHVIQFGGSLGFAYSPSSLNVAVGDTVKWQGDFSMHPLSSTSVPPGALTFHRSTGSSFTYAVASSYLYQCDFHYSLGMAGSFTATAASLGGKKISLQPDGVQLEQNYQNPFNSRTIIRFSLAVPQRGC